MSGSYFFVGFYSGKIWTFLEKRPFFRADMAGLGKYSMGGLGSIGLRDSGSRNPFMWVSN